MTSISHDTEIRIAGIVDSNRDISSCCPGASGCGTHGPGLEVVGK